MPRVLWNTRSGQYDKSLESMVARRPELEGHLLFASSGTTANAKWVCLSKTALLASASAVVNHLGVKHGDVWFQALPVFHVGGFGLYARAYLTQGKVVQMLGSWRAKDFVEQLERSKAKWISLVPTQLSDIVSAQIACPAGVAGVVVGGGAARMQVVATAVKLGWPILQSYGMSEAGSQIATAQSVGGDMILLDHLETKLSVEGLLMWRGSSQYSGYVVDNKFTPADGWVITNDRVSIDERRLSFLARADRVVKVLGELVDVDLLEAKINTFTEQEVVLKVVEDQRRGCLLIPIVEEDITEELERLLKSFNGLEKLDHWQKRTFPRNELGKVMKRKL